MVKLCDQKDCTGCSACYNACTHQALTMQSEKEGFLYPVIDVNKCKNCGLCEKVCPVLNQNKLFNNEQTPVTYAVWADDEIRQCSSSGGAFSILTISVLNKRGVVFGATINENNEVYHTSITDLKELYKLRGSKYVQSNVRLVYCDVRRYLKEDKPVLFSGTPCQIAGLKSFLGKSYPNLLLVDILCHGVPSPLFLNKTSRILSKRGYDVSKPLKFRNSKFWGYQVSYDDQVVTYMGKDDIYLQSFLKGLNFRESCYRCPFAALPRQGDITIGDFWGIGRRKVFQYNTAHGVSCVMINNSKGSDFWETVQGNVFCEVRDLEEAKAGNPNIYKATARPARRDTFYKDFEEMTLDEFLNKYRILHRNFSIREILSRIITIFHLRSFMNEIKSIIYK